MTDQLIEKYTRIHQEKPIESSSVTDPQQDIITKIKSNDPNLYSNLHAYFTSDYEITENLPKKLENLKEPFEKFRDAVTETLTKQGKNQTEITMAALAVYALVSDEFKQLKADTITLETCFEHIAQHIALYEKPLAKEVPILQFALNLLNALICVMTLGLSSAASYGMTGRFGFFNAKSRSQIAVEAFNQQLSALQTQINPEYSPLTPNPNDKPNKPTEVV